MTALVRRLKRALLPDGVAYRRIPVGIARSIVLPIDFAHSARQYFGLYEAELNSSFRRLVRPGDACFDVGGREGYSALLLHKLSAGGPVVSFEFDAAAVAEMKGTVVRNGARITVVQAFIAAADSATTLALDSAAERYFMPDFIKLDIEGGEADALRGAAHILRVRRPSLIVETHGADVEAACLEILRGAGYRPKIINQRRLFRESRQLAHNRWLVCPGAPRP